MASNLNWNPVSVNFNDASSFMRNAGDSISKAGTVFGELRKSILDEEQRRIENEFNQKKLEENIRQFEANLGLQRDQLTETGRHNKVSEELDRSRNDIVAQHYRWTHEDAQQRNKISNAYTDELRKARLDAQQQKILEAQGKAQVKALVAIASDFLGRPQNEQVGIMQKYAEAAKAGNPFAASVLRHLDNLYKAAPQTLREKDLAIMRLQAMESGDSADINRFLERDEADIKMRKERTDAIRAAQQAADLATATYTTDFDSMQRGDIEGDAAVFKSKLLKRGKSDDEIIVNTGNIIKELKDKYPTGSHLWGGKVFSELGRTGGDWGPTNHMSIFHPDNQFNDDITMTMLDLYGRNTTKNGRPLTPSERSDTVREMLDDRRQLFGLNPGTYEFPSSADDLIDPMF